jgi:hypothetical protein
VIVAANGWLYADGDAAKYDRTRALFPDDVLAWVQAAQPDAWQALTKNHGATAGEILLGRVRDQIDQRGTLDVLRHGVELLGLRKPLQMAQFKPSLAINPDILARYAANRLRVVRQLRYSVQNENCLDLVLFLNGIPVATAELKTDFTQSVDDAIDQYRFDRLPTPKGQGAEPLLSFPRGALVHSMRACGKHYANEPVPGNRALCHAASRMASSVARPRQACHRTVLLLRRTGWWPLWPVRVRRSAAVARAAMGVRLKPARRERGDSSLGPQCEPAACGRGDKRQLNRARTKSPVSSGPRPAAGIRTRTGHSSTDRP